jgi:hypothetical protein
LLRSQCAGCGIPFEVVHASGHANVEPDLGNSGDYVSFDGKEFNIKPEEAIRTRYEHGATLSRLVRTASRFAGAEKVGVHKIAANNPNVIDVEIAFTKSGEADETSTAPRMDIGALVRWPSGEPRLVFCEAKCANNAELSKPNDKRDKDANGDLRISVVSQILQYQQFIADNETPLINAYVNVCKILQELKAQGLKRHWDPIIDEVAAGQLSIHPFVYLLVYDFDDDKKKGGLRTSLDKLRLTELGNRIVAKGDAKRFDLTKDVLKQEP